MSSSMFTGVTGMLAHQRKLDVIANNIANVNTTGFRSQRAMFQDLFYQTLEGARGPVPGFGGTNPMQVGLGVQIGSIDTDYSQASLTTTGVSSDLAVQGNGFFILNDGGSNNYTRDGSFIVNAEGLLIEPATGQFVQGYQADDQGNINTNLPIANITIPLGSAAIVRETTEAYMTGNLNSDADVGDTISRVLRVYDSFGTPRDLTLTFTKSATTNEWDWAATSTDPDIASVTGAGTITFDSNGIVTGGGIGPVSIDFVAGNPSVPVDPLAFDLNLEELTQLSGESDAAVFFQDGYPRGVLESFDFGRDGVINGVFTNGLTRVIGQIALASFANNAGLDRTGNNQFRETVASGLPQIGLPNTGSRGTVSGGVLENSNVDLGREFSNLILTQRGFQANARTITAADTLLQETVNLVR
jgi:flagellar hook protein FlgE